MDHRPLVVYIAGPFRGSNSWIVEKNIRHAELVGLDVIEYGHTPLIPHSMYRFWNGTFTDSLWIELTKSLLRKCDAAVFIDGWEDSVGSVGEMKLAKELKIPFYNCSDTEDSLTIEEWLKDIAEDLGNKKRDLDPLAGLKEDFNALVVSHNQLFALVLKLQKKIEGSLDD